MWTTRRYCETSFDLSHRMTEVFAETPFSSEGDQFARTICWQGKHTPTNRSRDHPPRCMIFWVAGMERRRLTLHLLAQQGANTPPHFY